MDLLIPDSWLRKFLDTKASAKQIATYLSLCGPSIEKITKSNDGDYIYSIEITTNRVDSASVVGIAREAGAILPRFGIFAKLKNPKTQKSKTNHNFKIKVKYLDVKVDEKLCPRFTAVLIKDIKVKESPNDIKLLLEKVGIRPINNIVDVSNYIMHELGQPVHTFDYDKIKNHKMVLRESKKGEIIRTLDGKTFKLDGEDIVIEDGSGKLIDLCGIMGGQNSAIDSSTKNVLLFVQNYESSRIRKTSMSLNQRSEAAILFEKGLDNENIKPAVLESIKLIEKLSGGKSEKEILDIYPKPYKSKIVKVKNNEIDKIIGINIDTKEIIKYMTSLGFETKQQGDTLLFNVPSWRGNDINIKEDIVEEVARIYGYHNLPCILMSGSLPAPSINHEFLLEKKIKEILVNLRGIEVYNISLVDKGDIMLKNPLGPDTSYLRNNLKDSLISNIKNNPQEKGYIHFFEIANIYTPRKNDLPNEKLTLAGVIQNGESTQIFDFRKNKGIIENLLNELNINYESKLEDGNNYLANQRLEVFSNKEKIGEYGNLENGLTSNEPAELFFYEFGIQKLIKAKKIDRKYKEIAKYPPQIEDITLQIPEKTYVGNVINTINSVSQLINKTELVDIYGNNYTFNIEYQHPEKTLTDKEVKDLRVKILQSIKLKFGITVKD